MIPMWTLADCLVAWISGRRKSLTHMAYTPTSNFTLCGREVPRENVARGGNVCRNNAGIRCVRCFESAIPKGKA